MPRKKEVVTRTEYISFRVSSLEKKAIELAANDTNISTSSFARKAALNMKVTIRFNQNELQIYNNLHTYHRNFRLIGNFIRGNNFDKKEIIQKELDEVINLIKKHLNRFET